MYYVGGPTYRNAKILNKNKIQDDVGRHLGFLHKQQYIGCRLTQINEILQ